MTTIGADLLLALDPVRLAEAAGYALDEWQAGVARSSARLSLLNCSRQSGKSLTAGVLALHNALSVPGSLTLLVSPSLRQSSELFRTTVGLYRALDQPVPADATTLLRLELSNGARILSLPGSEDTIRGFSNVALLVVDEAARVEDEVFAALSPMLAVSRGRLVCLSTPRARRGWFFELWQSPEPAERVELPASQCGRIDPLFLEAERRRLPKHVYESEYECRFLDSIDAVFRSEEIEAALAEPVERWAL